VRSLWARAGCFRWGWRACPTGARDAFPRAGVRSVSAARQAHTATECQAFSLRPPQTDAACLTPNKPARHPAVLRVATRLMGVSRRGAVTGRAARRARNAHTYTNSEHRPANKRSLANADPAVWSAPALTSSILLPVFDTHDPILQLPALSQLRSRHIANQLGARPPDQTPPGTAGRGRSRGAVRHRRAGRGRG
jgi:hypothetical protein